MSARPAICCESSKAMHRYKRVTKAARQLAEEIDNYTLVDAAPHWKASHKCCSRLAVSRRSGVVAQGKHGDTAPWLHRVVFRRGFQKRPVFGERIALIC